jgi:hypothetical protein
MIDSLFRGEKYTTEELNARLKFFIGIVLGLTLFGIVFVVLYSLIFVTQPMNGMSPVDNKFFELIIPIATFLTGTLSGIMLAGDDKDARMKALDMASGTNKPTPPTSPFGGPKPPLGGGGGFSAGISTTIGGVNVGASASMPATPADTPAASADPAAPATPKFSLGGRPMPKKIED